MYAMGSGLTDKGTRGTGNVKTAVAQDAVQEDVTTMVSKGGGVVELVEAGVEEPAENRKEKEERTTSRAY